MPKIEVKVPNFPHIYKVVKVLSDGSKKPTGQYRVRRRFPVDGKWTTHTTTLNSFEDAKKIAKQVFVPAPKQSKNRERLTFQEAFAKFMRHKEFERKLTRGTISGYWNRYEHLKFFDPLFVSDINARIVDAWIDLLLDSEYRTTQQGSRICYDHEFTLLVCFFRYFRNYIDETFLVPILDRHRQRACARSKSSIAEIRFLNSEEEARFLQALAPWPTIQDLALFQLHTGARVGEAAAMEFRHVDYSRSELRIAQHLHWERSREGTILVTPGTKTGPTRNVPLTPECRDLLLRRQKAAHSSIIFESADNRWLAYRSIQAIYDRVFKRLGLPHTGTHVLRHTFAVRFLDQTKDIYALQKILGHTDLKVTQVYAKYSNESVRQSFRLFRGGLAEENSTPVPQLVPRKSV